MTKNDLHIHVTDQDGVRHTLPAPEGWRIMEIIRDNGLPIRAECGGSAACATCHVYVDAVWQLNMPAPAADEEEMLDTVEGLKPDQSRLSCQMLMTEVLDGLDVILAPGSEPIE